MSESAISVTPARSKLKRPEIATQWQLMWWKFRRHHMALIGLSVLGVLFVVAAFAEILRDNPYADDVDLEALSDEADSLSRDIDTDEFDEFVDMVENAARLS